MTLRWLVASLHLLALGIGLGAIVVRASALRGALDTEGLRRVFRADGAWVLAALLWISTGVAWVFFGLEKGTAYYLVSTPFRYKMGLLLLIVLLEIRPMATLIGWRMRLRRNELVDSRRAPMLARISFMQAALVVLMVFAASATARGLFF